MAAYVNRGGKPGAHKQPFRSDVIETYYPEGETTLLEFLITKMPQRKRTNIKELLKHRQVAVNGLPVTHVATELKPGDKVDVNLTREFHVFQNKRVKLLYEDDDILVIEKGYGLALHGK